MFTHAFTYRGRDFAVRQIEEGELALMLGKVVRKQCPPSDREPQYLWTNVELEWEEHHYIEVRYWATSPTSATQRHFGRKSLIFGCREA